MAKAIERVLIYRLGSLGDMIAALPALQLVERAYPNAERRMLTNLPINHKAAAAAAVLDGTGIVQDYFEYPVGARQPLVLLRLWWSLIRWRPQVLIYLAAARGVDAARRDANFFRACGIRRQIGVPLTEEMQSNLKRPDGDAFEPEFHRLARNLAELGDAEAETDAAWNMRLTAAEHARAVEALIPAQNRPVLAFSLGTKVQANHWGADNWHALLQRLGSEYPGHALVFTGVPAESEMSEQVAQGWRLGAGPESPVLNLCGQLSPRETAAVFARTALYLGHDSGPMHLAAAVGTPVVAIFSARNRPGIWFPRGKHHCVLYHQVDCMGCNLDTCIVQAKKCILSISVDEVIAGVHNLMPPA